MPCLRFLLEVEDSVCLPGQLEPGKEHLGSVQVLDLFVRSREVDISNHHPFFLFVSFDFSSHLVCRGERRAQDEVPLIIA